MWYCQPTVKPTFETTAREDAREEPPRRRRPDGAGIRSSQGPDGPDGPDGPVGTDPSARRTYSLSGSCSTASPRS